MKDIRQVQFDQIVKNLMYVDPKRKETKVKTASKRRDSKNKFICHNCDKFFSTKSMLIQHIRGTHIAQDEKDYKCPQCDYSTNSNSNIRRHLLIHDENLSAKPFECDKCDQKFTQKLYLRSHIKRMHPVKRSDVKAFRCRICNKEFGVEVNLKIHIRTLHLSNPEDKKYKCSHCDFSTHYGGTFKKHMVKHDKSLAFDCEVCGKYYATKASLLTHFKREHIGVKGEYRCTECEFQTHYKHSLEIHLNSHKGFKPYQCHLCEKRFSTKQIYQTHLDHNVCVPDGKKKRPPQKKAAKGKEKLT